MLLFPSKSPFNQHVSTKGRLMFLSATWKCSDTNLGRLQTVGWLSDIYLCPNTVKLPALRGKSGLEELLLVACLCPVNATQACSHQRLLSARAVFAEFMSMGSEREEELQEERGLPQLETRLQHGPEHVCTPQVRTPTGKQPEKLPASHVFSPSIFDNNDGGTLVSSRSSSLLC